MESKQSLQINESNDDHANRKFPAMAKGESLAEGLSHQESASDVGGMYKPDGDIARMPKDHDFIKK